MEFTKAPGAVLAATSVVVFAADQIAKAIVRQELTLCDAPPVSLCDRVAIAGPLGLLRTENGDGAFGLLAGAAIGPVLIVLLGVAPLAGARVSDGRPCSHFPSGFSSAAFSPTSRTARCSAS